MGALWNPLLSGGGSSDVMPHHFLIVTVQALKYDLTILAPTVPPSGSLSTRSPPSMSSDVGMDKRVSTAGSDFQPQDPGIWRGGGGRIDNLAFLQTHPEQTGRGPCPGLNPYHQSDLREKHSSIPEKRSHIYRSSGNNRRLMKYRLELERKRLLQCVTSTTSKQRHRKVYQTKA